MDAGLGWEEGESCFSLSWSADVVSSVTACISELSFMSTLRGLGECSKRFAVSRYLPYGRQIARCGSRG